MTAINVSIGALEERLREVAEGTGSVGVRDDPAADSVLMSLGFVEPGGLTEGGMDFYVARHVRQDTEAAADQLGVMLRQSTIASAFCGTLWGVGDVPVTGAVSLLKRLTGDGGDHSAKRWLELMNRGRLVAYNRKHPSLRVLFNPHELVPPSEEARRARHKGHVIAPETPYGNLLALRELMRAARGSICWYEQHMERKVLEVLYREVPKGSVTKIRLLSGPAHADDDAKSEFKRFAREMRMLRDIDCEWRILSKHDAQLHHDRFFFSDGIRRNLPPLNLILQGSTGEILPSEVTIGEFDEWWAAGQDLRSS